MTAIEKMARGERDKVRKALQSLQGKVIVDEGRLDKLIAHINCGYCPYKDCNVGLTSNCPLGKWIEGSNNGHD